MNSQVILELLRSTLFFDFWWTFLIFWPALRHQGWCQNIAQRSPKLFGKTSFLTLQTFLEHVWNMSKKCILYHHIMSYHIIWHHMIWYHVIWHVKIHFLDMFRTCSKKVWRVKNEVFPKSFGDLWAMFWHHTWCLRAGLKFKKVNNKLKK